MFNDRNKFNFVTICCWLSLVSLTAKINVHALSIQKRHTDENEISHGGRTGSGNGNALHSDATVPNFSPRLEYNNEWRPVGRGDPLQNDPTYDYSPPALDRVRYWRADNDSKDETSTPKQPTKKDYVSSNKKEILLLGMKNERQRGQTIRGESSVLQPKYTSIRRSYYAHQHQLPTHLMPPPMQTLQASSSHLKTSAAVEYRHNMPSSMTTMSMMHSKPYYSTSASSPWIHTSMSSKPTSVSSPPSGMMQNYRPQHNVPNMLFDHNDNHHQETINQFSYTRPSMGASFTPSNFVESSQNSMHHRKPWLHELLQKEVVKTPTKSTTPKLSTIFEHMLPSQGISTAPTPIAFVPLPTTTPQTTTSTSTQVYTTTSPVYFTTTFATTTTTPSTLLVNSPVTPTTNRLLIPTTSNLAHRPTVTPMEMTTDALFKHYKQPAKPLLGPMYLIIEGHSKVKTYGKDELDPHRPKIVPIIPKREPIVRIADPNEKRGTTETFQVKHLHTKTTSLDATPSTSRTTVETITTPRITTKTPKILKPTNATVSKSNTETVSTTTTTEKPLETTEPPLNMEGFFSFLDSSLSSWLPEEPTLSKNTADYKRNATEEKLIFVTTTTLATTLHPVNTTTPKPAEIEARIGSHGSSIESLLNFDDEVESADKITTEPVPRDVRQVFDYDQLPESRFKDRMDMNSDENDDNLDTNDEEVSAMQDDIDEDIDMEDVESLTADEYEDASHELIKRIDKLVDDIDDDDNEEAEFEELISAEVNADDDLEMRNTKEA